ncbi:hypothetical protein PVL29_015959 [Vitis rotundifolia]|uniref:Uncharacterized protein n=1 Tax=Vitis rotundifolia TaxID=103349 RepID=A0AA38ZET3_VITRO|nr:hypothetical protein PVL29_015959 [Vitis rotundifolia]
MATLIGVGVGADPGARASTVSTTTWNMRDMGGGAASSPGLDRGSMSGTKTNSVRLAAIVGFSGLRRISSCHG